MRQISKKNVIKLCTSSLIESEWSAAWCGSVITMINPTPMINVAIHPICNRKYIFIHGPPCWFSGVWSLEMVLICLIHCYHCVTDINIHTKHNEKVYIIYILSLSWSLLKLQAVSQIPSSYPSQPSASPDLTPSQSTPSLSLASMLICCLTRK